MKVKKSEDSIEEKKSEESCGRVKNGVSYEGMKSEDTKEEKKSEESCEGEKSEGKKGRCGMQAAGPNSKH
jgi:hypothetical protein